MVIISQLTTINTLYYFEFLYMIVLIGEFCIDNEIIGVKDRTGYFISHTQYSIVVYKGNIGRYKD